MNSPGISEELFDTVALIAEQSHDKRAEAFGLCETTLARARELHDDLAFIVVAQHYAVLIDQQGYPDAAINILHEALQLAQSHHLFADEAKLLNLIGRSLYTRAEYRQAMQAWARCLESASLAHDRITWIYAKIGIGQIYDALNDSETAVQVLTIAAEHAENQRNPDLILNAHLNLGVNLYRLGRYAEAEKAYAIVLSLSRELGHKDDEGETLFRFAEIAIAREQYDEALTGLAAAERLCHESSHWWGLANICLAKGNALAAQGKHASAVSRVREGLEHARHAGATHIEARLWHALAAHAEQLGDLQQAYAAFKQASQLDQQVLAASYNPQQQRELEDLAGLRTSPSRQLLELSTDSQLELHELDEVLGELAARGCDIVDVPQCSIWLREENSQQLRCICRHDQRRQQDSRGDVLLRQQFPVLFGLLDRGESIIAHVARYHQHTWQLYEHYLGALGIEALLCQPLQLHGQCTGLIMFEHLDGQHNWSADELLHASQLATIATRVIANLDRQRFLEDIAKLNVALRESNELLEARVRARTAELENANHDLAQAMNHLVQAEKIAALGNLVAGLAHELNTPLGINMVSATTLIDKVNELARLMAEGSLKKSWLETFAGEASEAAQLIVRNARRASDMMNNFKQVAVDTSSNQRRTFDLRTTLDEVLWALSPQYKNRPVEFVLDVPQGVLVDNYPGAFEQIMTNLISNSLIHGFVTQQTGRITISLLSPPDADECVLSYQDTGKGIPEALHKRVFEPFFTTRFGQGGSGLGLYLVYSLISGTLGGDVRLQTPPGGSGVLFELRFPRQAALDLPAAGNQAADAES
ncbi:ATP-binding protein [Chitinilyticum litopenaei]|uniref:ATP-binding protein n=1 Tax=Chitinilyticum litopenaei TaxID=1121276 RepID=UPI000414F443|nr:ATP-binding protein [Chitinilyticum litopenaei]